MRLRIPVTVVCLSVLLTLSIARPNWSADSTATITGVVREKGSLEPLGNAVIMVRGDRCLARTSCEGKFVVTVVASDTIGVGASKEEYRGATIFPISLDVGETAFVELELEPADSSLIRLLLKVQDSGERLSSVRPLPPVEEAMEKIGGSVAQWVAPFAMQKESIIGGSYKSGITIYEGSIEHPRILENAHVIYESSIARQFTDSSEMVISLVKGFVITGQRAIGHGSQVVTSQDGSVIVRCFGIGKGQNLITVYNESILQNTIGPIYTGQQSLDIKIGAAGGFAYLANRNHEAKCPTIFVFDHSGNKKGEVEPQWPSDDFHVGVDGDLVLLENNGVWEFYINGEHSSWPEPRLFSKLHGILGWEKGQKATIILSSEESRQYRVNRFDWKIGQCEWEYTIDLDTMAVQGWKFLDATYFGGLVCLSFDIDQFNDPEGRNRGFLAAIDFETGQSYLWPDTRDSVLAWHHYPLEEPRGHLQEKDEDLYWVGKYDFWRINISAIRDRRLGWQ